MSGKRLHRHELAPSQTITRYATLDIETTGRDAMESQLVAIGIGTVDTLTYDHTVDVLTYSETRGDEASLIKYAFDRINEFEPTALVTYNGREFDLPFLEARITHNEPTTPPSLDCVSHHIDLFRPRKRRAAQARRRWPKLEDVLATHGARSPVTEWRGHPVTNTRFGESLGPSYVDAIDTGHTRRVNALEPIIRDYTRSDVVANIVVYEADAGRQHAPTFTESVNQLEQPATT